ncbi:P-loop containing nucleoside triphosphate hydrolase protein [Xylaria sp. FL0043]|nr:P-loop containing nucleoside triphosphate hydrolase protein [Xylaria sp. FL0043]
MTMRSRTPSSSSSSTMGDPIEPSIILDEVALGELNSSPAEALLDTIDSLRELQVGEIVNLPQIIVVGDQSSGKSSVLEAISGQAFPTKGDVCTRFATELVMRRAPETKIDVRITVAGSSSSSAHQFRRTSFDKDTLSELISEATSKMGIRLGSTKGFSRDVLRIELTGPNVVSLTLVDLPGFFHSATEDQTREDKRMVREIAKHYMAQPKSIILAVVAANNNLANQKVVEAAMEHDPSRERTLGVITKPDLTVPGSQDEKKCLKLAKNQETMHRLTLGWHVLRNRPEGREQISSAVRNEEEESFFRSGAWASISPDNRGIAPLQRKLGKMLLEHIKKTLPTLVREIKTNLSARQRALEKLGRPREGAGDQRRYLLDIAVNFQRLVRDGLHGRYSDEFFGDLYESYEARKLRALIRRLNSAFYVTLVTKGIDRKIVWEDDRFQFQEDSITWIRDGENAPDYLEPYLDLFSQFPEPASILERNLHEELEKLAATNQGTEFSGLPNGDLGYQFFRMQVRPWDGIADFYLEQILSYARTFVEELFAHIIGADYQTADAIVADYVGTFFEKKHNFLKDKLREIFRPYAQAYGPPIDVEFHRELLSTTRERDAERVANILEENFPALFTERGGNGLTRQQVEQAVSSEESTQSSEFGIERIVDMTETHFQMSLKTFAQNVVNLGAENSLISDLHTILTPAIVAEMDDDRLRELASESEDVREKRQALQRDIDILKKGLNECRKSRIRRE